MTTFYTRRSAIVSAQRCPRKRYWEYLALPAPCHCAGTEFGAAINEPNDACQTCRGTGIQSGIMPERRNVPMLVGSAVHAGLERLLVESAQAVEVAVAMACAEFDEAVRVSGLALHETEEAEYVVAEQRALTEALVRLAALKVIPDLLTRYEVLWTERLFQRELAPGVVLRGQPDALLRRRETGDLFILSWKTKGGSRLDDRALEDGQHDDQGLSETWLVEKWLSEYHHEMDDMGLDIAGVIMVWLLKGERREYPPKSGRWAQSSPLIRGYRRYNDDGQAEYAHSYYWEDPLTGSKHKLGKGWEKFDAWLEPGGVKGWMDRLAEGAVQPDAGPCLDGQFVVSAPYYRQPQDIEGWIRQATDQESKVAGRFDAGDEPSFYRQHRHSCSYPSRCAYYQICWGAPHVRQDPLANGFVRRAQITQTVSKEGNDSNGE